MELIKENITINELAIQDISDVLVEGDIIVPDVKPDILKILQVDATSVITNKEITANKASLSGKLNLKILYIAENGEQSIKSINTTMDFVHILNDSKLNEAMYMALESDVAHIEFNVVNSRKLNIKAIVAIDTKVYKDTSIPMLTDIISDKPVQLMHKSISMQNMVIHKECEFILRDELEVPSGKSSILEVLKVDTKITDKDFKVVTGKIVVKGCVSVCTLYISDDMNHSIEFMEHEIPFTEVLDADGVSEHMYCEVDFSINDFYYNLNPDNDGDMRIMSIEASVVVHIRASETLNINVVNDCYCPGYAMKCSYKSNSIEQTVCKASTQQTIREIVAIDDNLPQMMGVYNVITKPYITTAVADKNRVLVEGMVEAYILYLTDSGDSPVFGYKKELPFNYILEATGSQSDMKCDIKAEIEHTSYSINVANEVELRAIVSISAKVFQSSDIALISDIEIEEIETTKSKKPNMIIYFAQNGDKLWDVAKSYGVPINSIAEINSLEGESINEGQQLVIPIGR